MRFECRICVLRLAFRVFNQIRYEHSHQGVCTKKMHRRNPQIPQGFLGIFHARKQDANKKMQMVKIGLWVGFEPMT